MALDYLGMLQHGAVFPFFHANLLFAALCLHVSVLQLRIGTGCTLLIVEVLEKFPN